MLWCRHGVTKVHGLMSAWSDNCVLVLSIYFQYWVLNIRERNQTNIIIEKVLTLVVLWHCSSYVLIIYNMMF